MKIIQLMRKKFSQKQAFNTIIDEKDYIEVSKYKWHIMQGCKTYYTAAYINKTNVSLHRFIMKPSKGMQVDHLNGNGLDNRRCNLEIVTPSVNQKRAKKFY